TFNAGAASAANSSISASPSSLTADGATTSTVTLTLKDANNNPISGVTPTFSSTGTGNTLVQPGATNASGQATGTIKSTVAEAKTVNITSPAGLTGVTAAITFVPGAASATTSTIGVSPASL